MKYYLSKFPSIKQVLIFNYQKFKRIVDRHIKSFHLKQVKKKSKKEKAQIDDNKTFRGLNCPYCKKFLTSKHSLNDHIRVKHEFINFNDRFFCDVRND
jgi:hypothetical protein